jgi:hypothetical protein
VLSWKAQVIANQILFFQLPDHQAHHLIEMALEESYENQVERR